MESITIDRYKHLNDTDPPTITISMEELVAMVNGMNYGVHRFLSELIRQRRADPLRYYPINVDGLEDLLEDGFF
jgi:hypothetical protein